MQEKDESGSKTLSNADLARVLSPLLLFLAHCVYLAFWSPEPFLNKWLDGSFSFFVSLVLCNIIRARVVSAAARPEEEGTAADESEAVVGSDRTGEGERRGSGHSLR